MNKGRAEMPFYYCRYLMSDRVFTLLYGNNKKLRLPIIEKRH
jgi:hypothetical protein